MTSVSTKLQPFVIFVVRIMSSYCGAEIGHRALPTARRRRLWSGQTDDTEGVEAPYESGRPPDGHSGGNDQSISDRF